MGLIKDCIKKGITKSNAVWFMRQAGRYLPEFRKIRSKNKDFIKLCLNEKLSAEITLQPLRRYKLDASIIFSDILLVPMALGQDVRFKKDYGPILGDLDKEINVKKNDFLEKLKPVYKSIKKVRQSKLSTKKDLIGFVGAPWTLLVYMLNKKSPKRKINSKDFNDNKLTSILVANLEKFLKIHIEQQIKNGATVIQIFDSWAGLVRPCELEKYVYNPTLNIVRFVKKLNVPVICFPKGIKNYKIYCQKVKPDAISIDYRTNPKDIVRDIKIPVQGGMDPKILLTDKETVQKEAKKYLDIFKDHPYIFNLGHGILPKTDPKILDYLIKTVKNY